MSKVVKFQDFEDVIDDYGFRDLEVISEDGKSFFEVDGEGRIFNIKVETMDTKFDITEFCYNDFIINEEQRRKEFINKYVPTNVTELSIQGVIDALENSWSKVYTPKEQLNDDKISRLGGKERVRELNKPFTVRDYFFKEVMEDVIKNNLNDNVRDKEKTTKDIVGFYKEDCLYSDMTSVMYFVSNAVRVVNRAVEEQ